MKKFAEIILSLKDNVSAGLGKLGIGFDVLKASIAAVSAFLVKSFIEFGKQEEAIIKLDTALKNSGVATEGSTQRLVALAEQLQKTTKFSDDASISAMALLGTFGLNEQAITKLLPRIQDMSTALGVDLHSASLMVGKAIDSGQVGVLSRYGIALDETRFKIDPLGTTLDALTEKFNGQSEAVGKGVLGSLSKLNNSFSDLQEAVGELTANQMTLFIDKLLVMLDNLQNSKSVIGSLVEYFLYFGNTIVDVFTFVAEQFGIFAFQIEQFAEIFWMLLTGRFSEAMETYKNQTIITSQGVMDSWNKMVDNTLKAYDKINTKRVQDTNLEKTNNATKLKDKVKDQQDNIKADTVYYDTLGQVYKKHLEDKKIAEQQAQKQKLADLQSTLGTISTLTDSHEKSMFAVGKAAAIANAIINTAQGVSRALGSAPPPLNFALAAAVGAAGAVQIHQIGATAMAEGGIVMPTSGGTLARIGEAGYPEAVIPLDDNRAESIMGNNITININAGTVVADDNSLRDFAEMIDEKLYSLKKGNQTIAI